MTGPYRLVAQAWRDLWRNRRRTLLTGMSMGLCSLIMVLMIGTTLGMVNQAARKVTDGFIGHAQIQHHKYRERPDLDHRISPEQMEGLSRSLDDDPAIKAWAPRIVAGGLISKKVPDPLDDEDMEAWRKVSSDGVMLVGLDVVREVGVTTLAEVLLPDEPKTRCFRGCRASLAEVYVADDGICRSHCADISEKGYSGGECESTCGSVCAGRCASSADEWCEEENCRARCRGYCEPARFLAPEVPEGHGEVVMGVDLARLAGVGPGDRVAVTTGTARGRAFGAIYRVVGIIKTSTPPLNRTIGLTHIGPLSEGMEMAGAATAVAVRFDDFEDADPVCARLQADFDGESGSLRALSWTEMAAGVRSFMSLKMGGTYFSLVIFTLIIGVIVANIVTMAVMERTREYGVRFALGESPTRVVTSLLTESVLLALVASVTGAAIGYGLVVWGGRVGFDMGVGEMETAGVTFSGLLYPSIGPSGLLYSVVNVVLFTLAGTVYPALRVRKIRPVEALQFT
jgi:ABC-type lipoprotein release transport system permease subunit